ncbi:hypothetical protein BpHYR1_009015 [Brachionus plicatilis]|uniref:Uncharacterized protein n=1 Tax=Brachionus plicatilis TaxID=10195 RepID=A0A3M7QDQ2_BRAPC|nr:hypothetical protein BpHYR1_009015 [Brachionus plicatilis]
MNKILVNDLNIIATKLDEIPETNLNLKLVLVSQECSNARLKWTIQKPISKSGSRPKENQESDANIFGFQVVVREYLEQKGRIVQGQLSSEEVMMKKKDQTLKVYSSKFIDSRQNKFKLVNLLRKDKASYLICLIIYVDVTETVAFEKQCVAFSLPVISDDLKCQSDQHFKNSPKKPLAKKLVTPMIKSMASSSPIVDVESLNVSQNWNTLNQTILNSMEKLKKNSPILSQHNCENTSTCRHYSNLIIAFVICGVLLGTNIFMFTIIIIQNTIKLGFLKRKLNLIKNNPKLFHPSNFDPSDRTLISLYDNKHRLTSFKTALCLSWSDFLHLICCGVFRNRFDLSSNQSKVDGLKNIENFGIHNEPIYDSDINQSCTTITRPGYILQVPNSSSSESSSDISTPFNKEKIPHHKFKKSEKQNPKKFSSNIEEKKLKRNNLLQNKYVYEERDAGLLNQAYAVSDFRQTEDLKNHLAYQQNNVYGHQISSAF